MSTRRLFLRLLGAAIAAREELTTAGETVSVSAWGHQL
jgi:hypothetical protein